MFSAWSEFKVGKINKTDVAGFAVNIEEQLFYLHELLRSQKYVHGPYKAFFVRDPKLRCIHKASVRDSYSSRTNKGTHAARARLQQLAWRLSANNTKTVWVLKCDIKKFFDSVDHAILLELLHQRIQDQRTLILLQQIIHSFHFVPGRGIPLGNLTSQLFSNIYLDGLDQYVKRYLRVKNYIRYADDFVLLSRDKRYLQALVPTIQDFLESQLRLLLHPVKVVLQPWHQGIDFLGYIHRPYHTILRTKTKRRMLKKVKEARKMLKRGVLSPQKYNQTIQSYLGLLKHCRSTTLKQILHKNSG